MSHTDAVHTALVAEFSARLRTHLDQAVQHPNSSAADLLDLAVDLSQWVEQAAFAAAVDQASRYETAPHCPRCAAPMHRHDRQQRVVVTLRGERSARYLRFRCPACPQTICPRHDAWGVRRNLAPAVQEVALQLVVMAPYRSAEAVLAELGLTISDNTLQRLAAEVGGMIAAQQEEEAAAVACLQQTLRHSTPPERLYLQCDGVKVRVADQWREVRLGLSYATAASEPDDEGQPAAAQDTICRGWLADCDSFCERFYSQAQAAGLMDAGEVVLLADGAQWIWERLPGFVPLGVQQTQILDFWHAAQHLAKAARAVHGEGSDAAQRCFDQLRASLRAGDRKAVWDQLRTLQAQAEGQALKEVTQVLNYLQTHRERISYQRLALDGYHIGSGQIESRCKQVGQRLKRPGANWSQRGLRALLALLTARISDAPNPLHQLPQAA